jgi:uncharacterized membrane protein YdjX (TVP38/TMEM64 family)
MKTLLLWLTAKLNTGFTHRYALRVTALLIWLGFLVAFYTLFTRSGLTPTEGALLALELVGASVWGPLVFIVFFSLRSLVFFPGSMLTLLAGIFFGLGNGILFTIIGTSLTAAVAYGLARFFGGDIKLEETPIRRFLALCRRRPFLAVFIMHLAFLPYDLVNYSSGLMRLPFLHFMLGNALGTIPGIVAWVSVGAAINVEQFRAGEFSFALFDPWLLALSAGVFLISLPIIYALDKHGKKG